MIHNSDGEETRPYAGGHLPPSARQPAPPSPPPAPWFPAASAGWQPPTGPGYVPPPPRRSGPGRIIAGIAIVAVIGLAGAGLWMYRSKSAVSQQSSETAATQPSPTIDATPSTSPTTSTTSPSTPAPAPATPPPSSAELASYLPSAGTLQGLLLTDPLTRTADAETTYTTVSTDRPDCGGAPNVALPTAYDRSGYTGIRTQEFFTQPGTNGQDSVTQAVAAFPSEQAAKNFMALETSRWGNCEFDLVTINNPDGDAIVRQMSRPNTKNGVLTLSIHSQMQSKIGCQRGLGSRRNIIIDVQICSRSGSAQAAELISNIAERIPTN